LVVFDDEFDDEFDDPCRSLISLVSMVGAYVEVTERNSKKSSNNYILIYIYIFIFQYLIKIPLYLL
jgi:hypothetical protein